MASNAPERALRRLVADLAATRPQDIAAVLDALEPAPRARTEALLRELAGGDPEVTPAAAPAYEIAGLSPWLAARLAEDRDPLAIPSVGPGAFQLTEAAQAALRQAAADLPRQSRPAPAQPSLHGWRRWLSAGRAGARA